MSLFAKAPHLITTSVSLDRAMLSATAIMRSDVFKTRLCDIYDEPQPHINRARLDALLDRNELFQLERIRRTDALSSRAQVLRQYDPWTIYLSPNMLLEMMDREREEDELNAQPELMLQPMLDTVDSWAGGEPVRRIFNSLIFSEQMKQHLEQKHQKLEGPPKKKPKPSPEPSGLPIVDTNTLMLTILLVHEATHLVNFELSTKFNRKSTSNADADKTSPPKEYLGYQITDMGHIVEKEIFGYVIQHSVDRYFRTPFAVQHIVGCPHEDTHDGFVLKPTEELLSLLRGKAPDEITSEMLTLLPSGNIPFRGTQHTVTVRAFESRSSTSAEQLAGYLSEKEEDNGVEEGASSASFNDPMLRYARC